MAVIRKRKTRTSRSRFGLQTSNKVIIISRDIQPDSRDQTSGSSSDTFGVNSGKHEFDGLTGRLRRNSTKLLSMLGFWGTGKTSNERTESCENTDRYKAELLQACAAVSEGNLHCPTPVQNLADDEILLSGDSSAYGSCSADSTNEKPATKVKSVHSSEDVKPRSGIRRSYSPGLTRRLSQRLSTLGHPTVIHRTNIRSRASVLALDGSVSYASLDKQNNDAQDSTDPSTLNSASDSPSRSQTTNPTSSDGVSRSPKLSSAQARSPGTRGWGLSLFNRDTGALEKTLGSIQEHPVAPSPSIVTVEATATAKIFFETHFNGIFSDRDSRSQRRRALEHYLHVFPVSPEELAMAREAWMAQESDYLRQSRVLNTRSNCIRHLENVSIAGYEVIRVLGKGSFGVVRLVKEKKETQNIGTATINREQTVPGRMRRDIPSLRSMTSGNRASRGSDLTKMTKEVFAMKVIRKSDMLRSCQEGHLRAERDFLVASENSQWIVPLIASFQDTNYLYLVMDYMVGGDFLGLLIRKGILSEEVTRWYVAEMVLCVEEAHRLGWIHRDVKPDNFLIAATGHLKISDFGLAFDGHWTHDQAFFNNHRQSILEKLGIAVEGDSEDRKQAKSASHQEDVRDKRPREPPAGERILEWRDHTERRRLARSIVGTSQYMAPEIIRGELYDGRCDWWSIGIILYECLYGSTPFVEETRHDTKIKILQHPRTLHFPTDKPTDRLVSVYAIDLISQILREKEIRLSCRTYHRNDDLYYYEKLTRPGDRTTAEYKGFYVYPNDASDIKSHIFFHGIRWDELPNRRPPFVPKVKSWEDTKYFDEDEPISDIEDSSSGMNESPTPPADQQGDVIMVDAPKLQPTEQASRYPPNEDLNDAHEHLLMKAGAQGNCATKVDKKKKEKKRPRDKALRDEALGKTVLDLRKKGAFLGYTYRRPRAVTLALEPERGRSLMSW